MNLDFILMAVCIFGAIFMASKKNTETTETPDIKKIIYTLLAVIATLLVETLCNRLLASLNLTGLVIAEVVAMVCRFLGVVLVLLILNDYRPKIIFYITLGLCVPLLVIIARAYYTALFNEVSLLTSGNLLESFGATSSAGKIGVAMVIAKAAPSIYLLVMYGFEMFMPAKKQDDDNDGERKENKYNR